MAITHLAQGYTPPRDEASKKHHSFAVVLAVSWLIPATKNGVVEAAVFELPNSRARPEQFDSREFEYRPSSPGAR